MGDLRKRGWPSSASTQHPEDAIRVRAAGPLEQRSPVDVDNNKNNNNSASQENDDRWVWRVCVAFRLVNALLVRTYFNPDEHWQALEVAHRVVFGYGHLTWEWERGIRSYVHPMIFSALYKLLALMGLDKPWFMARAPRLLQGVFAAVADLYLFKLSSRLFGHRVAYWTLFCQMINWFTFFCMVRTLSNSLETTLTVVALFYWSDRTESKAEQGSRWLSSRQWALAIAALSCVIRPTNGIIWLYMGVVHLFETRGKFQFLLAEVFPIGVVCLSLASLLDRWMYGQWIVVPLNFLKFNFFSSGGDFYGTHPWHWYFSQGFTVMVFSFLPISIAGMWWAKNWLHAGLIGWVLTLYSILGHKEFRFVLPVLPLSMMFAGYGLTVLEHWSRSNQNDFGQEKKVSDLQLSKPIVTSQTHHRLVRHQWSPKFRWIIFGLLFTNVPTALYTSMIHQRGGEAVMEYLAEEAYHSRVKSVLFLMPCHSTPFYSSLHNDLPMRFLDCSPSDEAGYVDEADRFKSMPMEFLQEMFTDVKTEITPLLPSHVVLYDSLEPQVRMFLERHSYKLDQKFFHAHFPVDRELQGHVLVFSL